MRTVALGLALFVGWAGSAQAAAPSRCTYRLQDDRGGRAILRIAQTDRTLISVVIVGAAPDTLYTVWNDFRVRPDKTLPAAHPALATGVAPALPLEEPFTNGIGRLDGNGLVTDADGRAVWATVLDYRLDEAPVVAAGLAMAGANRLGGAWLPVFAMDPETEASLQLLDDDGQPLIERGVVQGLTIVRHAAGDVTHGATPGVGGVNHFPGFAGNFPDRCRL